MDRDLLEQLKNAALPGQQIFLVGGSVRDLLRGVGDIKDIDLLVPAGSEDLARSFAGRIGGAFFVLDEERRICRVVKEERGMGLQFDFAGLLGADLETDLGRRDFTINAMALDLRSYLATGSLDAVIDLFGGRDDVRNGIIRTSRASVLDEDPLRLLRAVRFAAGLGFAVEPGTRDQIRTRAALVVRPAPERIRDELFQILSERGAADALLLMDDLGLLQELFPEVEALRGFAPGMYHAYDVRTHSLRAVAHVDSVLDDLPKLMPAYAARVRAHLDELLEHLVPRKAALRFACLLHDIAKPETFTRDGEGHIHFYGHDNLGAEKAKGVCNRFRLSRDTEVVVASLIKQHMRLFNLSAPGGPSRNSLYRYCRDLNQAVPESLLLCQADARATYDIMPREKFLDTERPMATVMEYYYEKYLKTKAKPLLTGHDLIERGFKPGPTFREILDDANERQAAGMLQDRKAALKYLDGLAARKGP